MNATVSFTTNACITDTPYIEKTLRHMMRSFRYPFIERIVALDPGKPKGKYTNRGKGEFTQLRTILDKLQSEAVIDSVVEIPWTGSDQSQILSKYFGNSDIELKDFSGAPIYQYLYAIDLCKGDYVLHVDSDMLFYSGNTHSWIDRGIHAMQNNTQVVFTTPKGGPPQANNWLERLIGKPLRLPKKNEWHKATFISTRYFLMDRERFIENLVPLQQEKPAEPLENSLSYTARKKGFERWSLNTDNGWAIHPWQHDDNFIDNLDDLIELVEYGFYPFRRGGFRWDMRTDGEHIRPWIRTINRLKK